MQEEQEKKPNPVVQRVKLIMVSGHGCYGDGVVTVVNSHYSEWAQSLWCMRVVVMVSGHHHYFIVIP